jgi:hypothetical protein
MTQKKREENLWLLLPFINIIWQRFNVSGIKYARSLCVCVCVCVYIRESRDKILCFFICEHLLIIIVIFYNELNGTQTQKNGSRGELRSVTNDSRHLCISRTLCSCLVRLDLSRCAVIRFATKETKFHPTRTNCELN